MKKPYLTQFQRQLIYLNTVNGDFILLDLAFTRLLRDIKRSRLFKILYR